jgi:enoyl-CoA hydratase/carnithine racemase
LQKESEQGARALTEFVKIEKGLGPEGRISVVRFDRGDGINALSPEALRQLTNAARSFEDDGGTSVVVLTGAPEAFSAGFDLKDAEGRSRRTMDIGSLRRHLRLGPRLTRAWQEMEQITIGAIEGFCIGGGVALAVALDFRIMGRDAHLRVPEIGLGMNMSWQSIPRMLHLMGPARTKQAVILADQRISAADAHQWGLVEEVVDPGNAFDAAMELAAKVAAQPPLSVAMTKLTVNRLAHALDDGRRPVRTGEPDRRSQGRRRGVPGPAQAPLQRAVTRKRDRRSHTPEPRPPIREDLGPSRLRTGQPQLNDLPASANLRKTAAVAAIEPKSLRERCIDCLWPDI